LKNKRSRKFETVKRSQVTEIYSDWFDSLEEVETPEKYLECLPAGSAGRKLVELWLASDSSTGDASDKATLDQTTPDPNYVMSLWYFLGRLLAGLNCCADDLIVRGQQRIEATEAILKFKGILEAASPGRWKDPRALEKFAPLLIQAGGDITSNLRELRSLKLASECISKKHPAGHELLLKCFTSKAERLAERTESNAQEYEHQLREVKSDPGLSATLPSELREIDVAGVEEAAREESKVLYRKLFDIAHAEMLIAFDSTDEARKILKPYLEGDGDPEEE